MIKQLLDGNLESNQYEDMLRDMFGIYAYVAFTMDKVIQNLVRQLQHMVGDEVSQQCSDLFLEEVKNDATGGPCATAHLRATNEVNYLKKAEQLLEDENCYKATIYKNESKLTICLLDTESQDSEDNEDPEEKWSSYMNNEFSRDSSRLKSSKRWFLTRNVRRYMAREEKLMNISNAKSNAQSPSTKTTTTNATTAANDETHDPPNNATNNIDKSNGSDKATCSFSPDSYRRLLVINNSDHVFFYRHHRPTRLRQTKVTELKRIKFEAWTKKWVNDNLSSDQIRRGFEWLGKGCNNNSVATNQRSREISKC